MLQAPGIIEICVYRSLLGSPQIRLSLMWQTLADWVKFAESPERQKLQAELPKFATDIEIELWGPSPVVPDPLQPGNFSDQHNLNLTKMDF